MTKHSTEEAVKAITRALEKGASLAILKHALLLDGFSIKKAEVIILWALQNKEKSNEKDSRNV